MTLSTIIATEAHNQAAEKDRIVERDSTGRLWFATYIITSKNILRFYYSDDEGLNWTEATGLQITVDADPLFYIVNVSFWINAEHDFAGVLVHWRNNNNLHDDAWYYAPNFDENSSWTLSGTTPNLSDDGNHGSLCVMSLPETSNVLLVSVTANQSIAPETINVSLHEYTNTGTLVRETAFLRQGYSNQTAASHFINVHYRYEDYDKASLIQGVDPDLYIRWSAGLDKFVFSSSWPYYSNSYVGNYSFGKMGVFVFVNNAYYADKDQIIVTKTNWAFSGSAYTQWQLSVFDLNTNTISTLNMPGEPNFTYDSTGISNVSKRSDGRYQLAAISDDNNGDYYLFTAVYDPWLKWWGAWEKIYSSASPFGQILATPRIGHADHINYIFSIVQAATYHIDHPIDPYVPSGLPVETPTTIPLTGGSGDQIQIDANGIWWLHIRFDSYKFGFWYSEDNGITWTKSVTLTQRFGNPSVSKFHIDLATNRAVMWQGVSWAWCPDIHPTATWQNITAEFPRSGDNATVAEDLIHFANPNDSTKFFIVFTPNYFGTNDYGRFEYVEFDTQLNTYTENHGLLWSESVGAPGTKLALIHNGDGYTPKNGNPDLYFLNYDNPDLKVSKAAWNSSTETWDNAAIDILVTPDNRYGSKYFEAVYSGTELYIVGLDSLSANDANVSVWKLTDANVATDISPAAYWDTEVPAIGTGLNSIDIQATYDLANETLNVYIQDLYGQVSRNIYDGNVWSGWETVVSSGIVYDRPDELDTMYLNTPRYINGIELATYVKPVPMFDSSGGYLNYRVVAPLQTWLGSRFGIASGLRALSRLANGLGAAVRIAAGTKL